jgi:hypothetical protein
MKNYFKDTEFILDSLYFYCHGNRYYGKGIMTWKSNDGFHLEAFLDGQSKTIDRIDLGWVKIPSKQDTTSIRMRPQGYDWAIAPNINLSDRDQLNIQNNRLSLGFWRVIFCDSVIPILSEAA